MPVIVIVIAISKILSNCNLIVIEINVIDPCLVPQCILFKVALMAFDCVRGQGPGYFDDVLVPVHTVVARARLRSADHSDMVVPRSCTVCLGQRSFRSSAPCMWNDLLSELKNSDIIRRGFKSCLKSWLFEHAFL